MELPASSVALLGGTGRSGPGLALRFAMAGMRVHIGSREATRGEGAAAQVSAQLAAVMDGRAGVVSGHGNAEAAGLAEVAFVTVPYEGQRVMLPELAETLAGRVVVSTAVPMSFNRERGPEAIAVPEGSAAEQVAALLPRSRVVAGFHSLSSSVLALPERAIDAHVIVTGDDEVAKATAMALAELLAGVRAVDGGPLRYARQSEALTVLLLSINRIYRRHAGVIVTDLP
ncbi:MAG TPA: NADPH-dependent F420 reductase [Candidatus Dormibacteraeota bacterium]